MGFDTDTLPNKKRELIYCCKTGDLDKIKYLLNVHEIEVHFRDEWDTTPLYYACLCGHHDVVKFLLQNGARCEANTFDGERCFYAALTDYIKKTLSDYKMITSRTMRRGLYDEFLRRLLESASFSDCSFRFNEFKHPVHKCIIAARCSELHVKLRHLLSEGKNVKIKDLNMHPQTLQCILHYIYTGHMQASAEASDCIISLSKQFGLNQLASHVHETVKELQSFKRDKPGVSVDRISIEHPSDIKLLKTDINRLVIQAVPKNLHYLLDDGLTLDESDYENTDEDYYSDISIHVNKHRFRCHRLFYCSRSDYFKTLIVKDSVLQTDSCYHVTLHDISAEIFTVITQYIYTHTCLLTDENVYEVLYTADMFLLPGLTKLSASYIGTRLDTVNIYSAIETSRLFKLDKLENQCMSFIAENLYQLVEGPELSELILSDARAVKHRQETDTVDVIDSIRYHINNQRTRVYNSINNQDAEEHNSEVTITERKLQMLDALLMKLGLDC